MKLSLRLPLLAGLLACLVLPSLHAATLLPQTILTPETIPTQPFPGDPFLIDAPRASSKLPVAVRVGSGPATIVAVGKQYRITPTGLGLVTLVATQAGNTVYAPAPFVKLYFRVKMEQTIIMSHPANALLFGGVKTYTVNVSVRSSSGLPIELTVISGPATVKDNRTVTATLFGSPVILEATQPGNADYAPASPVTRKFTVYPGKTGGTE